MDADRSRLRLTYGLVYALIMNTSASILAAIQSDDLEATIEGIMIVLKINDQAFCRLACLKSGSPTARVANGNVVRISPSPSIRDGFQITCLTGDEAKTIAHALQRLIDTQYPHVFNGGSL